MKKSNGDGRKKTTYDRECSILFEVPEADGEGKKKEDSLYEQKQVTHHVAGTKHESLYCVIKPYSCSVFISQLWCGFSKHCFSIFHLVSTISQNKLKAFVKSP